ncbi:MAG TPA: hypothetical protein VE913_19880, partial [Longimicrobium sp.]|nr:hypothetical protein [Longimicrobium sp.]
MTSKRNVIAGSTATLVSAVALTVAMLTNGTNELHLRVNDFNASTSIERALCLAVVLGPAASSECGDLRLVHALPAVRTRNKLWAPALLFNSQHAEPHPVIAANVTLPERSGLSRVVATLRVNGTPRAQGVWRGNAWPQGPARIAVGYRADSDRTGAYRYTLEVRAHYG